MDECLKNTIGKKHCPNQMAWQGTDLIIYFIINPNTSKIRVAFFQYLFHATVPFTFISLFLKLKNYDQWVKSNFFNAWLQWSYSILFSILSISAINVPRFCWWSAIILPVIIKYNSRWFAFFTMLFIYMVIFVVIWWYYLFCVFKDG